MDFMIREMSSLVAVWSCAIASAADHRSGLLKGIRSMSDIHGGIQ